MTQGSRTNENEIDDLVREISNKESGICDISKAMEKLKIKPNISILSKDITFEEFSKFIEENNIELPNVDWNNPRKIFGIAENDRLQNYQIYKYFVRFSTDKRINSKESNKEIEVIFNNWIKPVLDIDIVFEIPNEEMSLVLHTDFPEELSPFTGMIFDCNFTVNNKTYYSLALGTYGYDDDNNQKYVYRAVTTCYVENNKMYFGMFGLDKNKDPFENKGLNLSKKDIKELRNIVYGCLNLFNEKEIVMLTHPLNPKNNVRRKERGAMPLPESKKIICTGKLRQYLDSINTGTGIERNGYRYKFWVRGSYVHFRNFGRYKRLYKMDDDKLHESSYSKNKQGFIRKWKLPFEKGEGLHIKQRYKFKSEDKDDGI